MKDPSPDYHIHLNEAGGGCDPVRLSAALNMLISEEDIIEYLRSHPKNRAGKHSKDESPDSHP